MSEIRKLIQQAREAFAAEQATNVIGAHATGIVLSIMHEHHDMSKGEIAAAMGWKAQSEVTKRLTIALYDVDDVIAGCERAGVAVSIPNAYDWARFFRDGKLTRSGKFPPAKAAPAPAKPKFSAAGEAAKLRKQYNKRQLAAVIAALSA